MKKISIWSVFFLTTLLTACGSGSGESVNHEDGADSAMTSPVNVQSPEGIVANSNTESKPDQTSMELPEERFQIVLEGEAVLDRETGLVWEKTPEANDYKWYHATLHCYNLLKGGRYGWRVPTIDELGSLSLLNKTLPQEAPFHNSVLGVWWSSTTDETEPGSAFIWNDSKGVGFREKALDTSMVWCVRVGQDL